MAVWFYPETPGMSPFKEYIHGSTGSQIQIPAGRYYIVSHPAESEVLRTSTATLPHQHSIHTRHAYSSEVLFGISSAPADLILEPETTWVASAAEVDIEETGISYMCVKYDDELRQNFIPASSREQVITLYPADPMCYYSLEVRNLEFDAQPVAMSGVLRGLARGLYPATLERHIRNASVAFECINDNTLLHSEFVTFGYHPDSAEPHLLQFYVKTSDGKIFALKPTDETKVDLSDQVRSAPDPRHVHLIVDFEGQKFILNPESQGQFETSGTEFIEINEEINI